MRDQRQEAITALLEEIGPDDHHKLRQALVKLAAQMTQLEQRIERLEQRANVRTIGRLEDL